MTICLQCAMEAMLLGERYQPTDESPEVHAARVHPDLAVTKARRKELELALAEKLRGRNGSR